MKILQKTIDAIIKKYTFASTEIGETHMGKLNARCHYGMSFSMLKSLGKEHRICYEQGFEEGCYLIEERLTDANFHTECSYLATHQYKEYQQVCKSLW